ncbi:MAG: LysE family translocator [Kutzneria sp.]|nr:LysE family translocator [Kutzneria sp.]
MTPAALAVYTLAAVLMAITPGLDTLLVLRSSLTQGRTAGLAAILGITVGCLVWAVASILGLSALLAASTLAYDVVRLAGAGYLIWLGGAALWRSFQGHQADAPQSNPKSTVAALRGGLTTNLLNPKVGAFYLSLLPQFLPTTGNNTIWWAVLLVAIHLSAGAVWLTAVAWLAGRAKALLTKAAVRRWLDRVTAGVLVAFGLKIALD